MKYNIPKSKKVIYYIVWVVILVYLYVKFADIHPFGKDSAFYQNSCKTSKAKLPKEPLKFKGLDSR